MEMEESTVKPKDLQLSNNESSIYRYDFSFRSEPMSNGYVGAEDSLIFTDKRVIHRVMSGRSFAQREMLLDDLNQVSCTCANKSYIMKAPMKKTLPIFAIILVLAVLLLIFGLVRGIPALMILAGIMLLVGVIVFAVLANQKRTEYEYTLCIEIYGRTSERAVILIEKKFVDMTIPLAIANEIGSVWINIQSGKTEMIKKASD
ncbi:MAG: hypothetical protein J5765_00050 [Clostridia bacterium]|nr:hypothetical protein [Clostridia bacterium]